MKLYEVFGMNNKNEVKIYNTYVWADNAELAEKVGIQKIFYRDNVNAKTCDIFRVIEIVAK